MSVRRIVLLSLVAVVGLFAAVAITTAATELTSQRIGLQSEPLTAGSELVPAPGRTTRTITGRETGRTTEDVAPERDDQPTVSADPPPAEPPQTTQAPPVAPPPADDRSGSGSGDDDGSGRGRGRGRGRGGDDD
jgi:hypothetical protein